VEVRFQDLTVETDIQTGGRALPSVSNTFLNIMEVCLLPNSMSTRIPPGSVVHTDRLLLLTVS
jgi:hypothetical protein